jgi:hypothetical protein
MSEYPAFPVNSVGVVTPFRIAFGALLATISRITRSKWVCGNISGTNLFVNIDTRAFAGITDSGALTYGN